MSSNRNKTQIIDRLEEVSEHLLNYVSSDEYQEEFTKIFGSNVEEYLKPLKWPIIGRLYSWYRIRGPELTLANEKLSAIEISKLEVLEIINGIFKNGAWKSTSANTTLMMQLVEKIEKLHEYAPGTIEISNLQRLNELFLDKLTAKMLRDIFLEAEKKKREQEISSVRQEAKVSQRPPVTESVCVNSSQPRVIGRIEDNVELNHVANVLTKLFEKKFGDKPEASESEIEEADEKTDVVNEQKPVEAQPEQPIGKPIQFEVNKENPDVDLTGFKEKLNKTLSRHLTLFSAAPEQNKEAKKVLPASTELNIETTKALPQEFIKAEKIVALPEIPTQSENVLVLPEMPSPKLEKAVELKSIPAEQESLKKYPTQTDMYKYGYKCPENEEDYQKRYSTAFNRMQLLFRPREMPKELGTTTQENTSQPQP